MTTYMTKRIPTLSLPFAVVIAGLFIAISIIITANGPSMTDAQAPTSEPPVEETTNLDVVAPVTSADHIYGNPNAPITLIEYSDLDCPFCDRFHGTMEQLVAEYPDDVRWVYRHFPLDFHPHAYNEAIVAECVGKLGGSDAFWKILRPLLAISSSQSAEFNTDPIFAETNKLGINTAELSTCIDSGEFKTKIDQNLANGAATGGNGTPWTIVIGPDGQHQSISGAQPYTVVKSVIDGMLK